MAKYLQISEGCKLKWRSLRDVYRRELKKYQSRLNDPNITDKNLPRWFYFKELQFLTEHLSGLEGIAESPQETEEYFESMYVKSEPDLLDDEEITLEADDDILLTLTDSKLQNEDRRKSEYCFQIADTGQLEENQFERSVKYYRDTSKRSLDSIYEDRSRKRVKAVEKNDRDGDSDYHFLMSLLPFLKTIPQRRKMIVRTKIQNIFCEEIEAEANSS
ncbi:uncharacterized protein LOC108909879 isoform X2 [Anoplophora glabripennis]|uniref:uncharacterized protein LOC108909879 isoform X2 n=1 Tax=Anoplophora glabripennis TaxID=217634 RepID=UPI0008759F64|nr:uncharacterized protein LOC108909879 isoform X2 [Anoplophora glabripennis]